jgi:hypothetical protein
MKPEVRSKSLTSRSLQQVPSLAMEQNMRGFVPSLGVSGFETQAAAFCMKSKRISAPVPSQLYVYFNAAAAATCNRPLLYARQNSQSEAQNLSAQHEGSVTYYFLLLFQ